MAGKHGERTEKIEPQIQAADQPSVFADLTRQWGWFVGLGIVMVALGIYGFSEVVGLTIASVLFIGMLLVIGGVIQCIHTLRDHGWSGSLLHLLGGALYIIAGALVINAPIAGSFIITFLLAASLIAGGVMRIAIALRHQTVNGWWLLPLGGAAGLLLGLSMLWAWPFPGLLVLGTFVAIELIITVELIINAWHFSNSAWRCVRPAILTPHFNPSWFRKANPRTEKIATPPQKTHQMKMSIGGLGDQICAQSKLPASTGFARLGDRRGDRSHPSGLCLASERAGGPGLGNHQGVRARHSE